VPRERPNPASVPAGACRYAVSRSSSAVREWEHHNPDNVRQWLPEHVAQCIRRDSLQPAAPWEWAPRGWLRRHLRPALVRPVVPVPRASVQGSAMFRGV